MQIKNIDSTTLEKWLKNDEAILVDVREPSEHAAEKISNANLLPLSNISTNRLPELSNKKLVIHCHSGKRGIAACQKLLQEDPDLEIYNLEGGISAWSSSGFETKKSGKNFLPLDQQVQLTIGIAVLTGSLLGYFVNENFFILSAFFGAGLIFAGISGFCGLAIFMAKMPWNSSNEDCKKVKSCNVTRK
jgi:rhodanese-related sulfurtransferase